MNLIEKLRHYAAAMRPSGLGGPGHGLSPDRAPLLDDAAAALERKDAEIALKESELDAIHKSHADMARRLAEAGEEIVRLRATLKETRVFVWSMNEAEHMMDGFGPRSHQTSDDLLARVNALISD